MAGSPLLNVMKSAVQKTGRAIARDFGELENIQGNTKKIKTFIEHTKTNAFNVLIGDLEKSRENFGYLSSMGEKEGKSSERWLIDIISGEDNFSRSIPHWAISVALEENGETIAGVVYDIVRNETYFAQKGYGAFVNDRRLKISDVKNLENTIAFSSFQVSSIEKLKDRLYLEKLLYNKFITSIKNMGSFALDISYVAAGKGDICFLADTKPYEVAAAGIIAKEAGLFVSNLHGKKDFVYGGTILVATPTLHSKVLKLLKD